MHSSELNLERRKKVRRVRLQAFADNYSGSRVSKNTMTYVTTAALIESFGQTVLGLETPVCYCYARKNCGHESTLQKGKR